MRGNDVYKCTVCVQVATIAHLLSLDDPRPPCQGGLPHASFKDGLFATEEGTIDFDAYRGSCVASTEEETSRRGGRESQRQPAGRWTQLLPIYVYMAGKIQGVEWLQSVHTHHIIHRCDEADLQCCSKNSHSFYTSTNHTGLQGARYTLLMK